MSWPTSGACLGHIWDIIFIWVISGASSGACLGIIWSMSGASSGVCLGHHLGHVWDNIWDILSTMDNNPRCYMHLCRFLADLESFKLGFVPPSWTMADILTVFYWFSNFSLFLIINFIFIMISSLITRDFTQVCKLPLLLAL